MTTEQQRISIAENLVLEALENTIPITKKDCRCSDCTSIRELIAKIKENNGLKI